MVTSNGCPTADAARRVQRVGLAYAKLSGHVMSSKLFEVRAQLQCVVALVDSTLLHGGQLWLELPSYLAGRLKGLRTRWLRKATASCRVHAAERVADNDLRVTYLMPSVWSLLRCQRLRYWATLQKASPFFACFSAECWSQAVVGFLDRS
jgi:hypothetical protein